MCLHDCRSVNDRWLSDRASSSDLDIDWWGTDRCCGGDKQDERSGGVHLLDAEWLHRKQVITVSLLRNSGAGSTSAASLRYVVSGVGLLSTVIASHGDGRQIGRKSIV